MVKAVTFDLWNTLITNVELSQNRVEAFYEAVEHLNISRERVSRAYDVVNKMFTRAWETPPFLYCPVEDQVKDMTAILGVDLGLSVEQQLVTYFRRCLFEQAPHLHAGVVETLEALVSLNVKIGLISDSGYPSGKEMRELLARLGILRFFDTLVFSDETGFHKPNLIMFDRTLGSLGVAAVDTLHVGDLLRTDVAGARAAGMQTAWVDRGWYNKGNEAIPDYVIKEVDEIVPLVQQNTALVKRAMTRS